MRKKNCLSAASLAFLASSAFAADLPSRKAPVIESLPSPMWTGFYAGLNAGYVFGTNSNTSASLWNVANWTYGNAFPPPDVLGQSSLIGGIEGASQQSITQSGFIGGGQLGYNHQLERNFVVGFEADFQGITAKGGTNVYGPFSGSSSTVNAYGSFTGTQNGFVGLGSAAGLNYLGTARGRAGYLIRPELLVYGTAGLAYGGAWANVAASGSATSNLASPSNNATVTSVSQAYIGGGRANSLLVGYSAGGGVEWMFMPNWSLKGEATYYNLGNMNVPTALVAPGVQGANNLRLEFARLGPGLIAGNSSINYQGIIARVGINYHFDFGKEPTVIAKY